MKGIRISLAVLCALATAAAADVSKEDLRKLAAAGISDEVILTFIRVRGPVQNLTADDVVDLKKAGASDRVLAAAVGGSAPPAAPAAPARTVSAPSATYVVDATPSVYYYGSAWYGSCYPSSYWPSYYYPRYYYYPRSYFYPTASFYYSRPHSYSYSPPRSYSSIRTGSRARW